MHVGEWLDMSAVCVSEPVPSLKGKVCLPGDKSISHRALILGAMARGTTEIRHCLMSADTLATQRVLTQLGVGVAVHQDTVLVSSRGWQVWCASESPLDFENSATGMRLMMGALAGQPFDSTLCGDVTLHRRPMRRVADPLVKMGAAIELSEAGTAPIRVRGGEWLVRHDAPLVFVKCTGEIGLAVGRSSSVWADVCETAVLGP